MLPRFPVVVFGLLWCTACSSRGNPTEPPATTSARSAASTVASAVPSSNAAPAASVATEPAPPPPTVPPPDEGENLIAPALELFRVAACGDEGEVPARLDRKLVDAHCDKLKKAYEEYRTKWIAIARPFIDELRPADVPKKVVYPFGGGDLVTALTVYPDADEITTMSLEPPGDVRRIDSILPERLHGALAVNAHNVYKLLGISYSNTVNLGKNARAALPGEIGLLLAALVVHGYEPTALRYFKILPDGTLHYLSAAEVEAEGTRPHAAPEGEDAHFPNVEIRFHKPGSTGPDKIARHIAHDLSNTALGKDPGLLAYLVAKGPVSVMTKAASHLLWSNDFSAIRDYLLEHAVWMISDSTGVPPRYARAAGFVQDTYGKFDGPARYGPVEALDGHAFRQLFTDNPAKPLPFQFGYSDVHHHFHVVVMHKSNAPAVPAPGAPGTAAPRPSAAP